MIPNSIEIRYKSFTVAASVLIPCIYVLPVDTSSDSAATRWVGPSEKDKSAGGSM